MNSTHQFLSAPLSALIYLILISFCSSSYSSPYSNDYNNRANDSKNNDKSDNETLMDIYTLAKQNDHQFKSNRARYLANSEISTIGRAAWRPQINGTATTSRTHTDTTGTLSQKSRADDVIYGVSLTQAIIDTSLWSTYQQNKVEQQVAAVTFEADQQSLIIRTAQAYFNVLRASDQLQTAKAEEKAQATLLEQTQQRHEVGLISINDVHETQAAYDSAVAASINASANLGIQYDSLTVLTNKFHSNITPLKKSFTAVVPTPNTQQAWVTFATKHNLSLKISELNASVQRWKAKAARNKHLPTLSGSISYTDGERDVDIINDTPPTTDTNTAVFSLNLNIPLYTGGALSAQQRQAEQQAIQAQEDFLLAKRRTIQNTRSLYLSVTTDIAQIKARKQAILSNSSALEATKAGYDAGTRDIVDVVNAQQNLFQAQRDYLDTLYDYIINTLLLKEAAGNLQVSDLEKLEQSLQK